MIKKTGWILISLLFFFKLFSVEVKKIVVNEYLDFQKGNLKGTSLDNKGRLCIGPKVKAITGPKQEYYLSLDISKNGNIYIGTGHQAAVYRLNSSSDKIERIFTGHQNDVYALLVSSSETVYMGTSPNGKIYQLKKDKKIVDFFDPDEKFIWDMKEDKKGNIICATGNNGCIYEITKAGDARKIFTAEDFHLVSVYISKDNSIYVGSGNRGILYKVKNRKAKVVFDTPFEEVKGICEDNEGNLYFAATKGVYRKDYSDKGGIESLFADKTKTTKKKIVEKSALYYLNTDGVVETIWTSKDEYIYAISYDEKENGVIVGTGNSGRVFRIHRNGEFTLLFESESAQIFKIARNKNEFVMITSNIASVLKMEEVLNGKGTYLSEVCDLKVPSKLGRIYWDTETLENTGTILFVRTGNSNIPDKTWTTWSPPFTDKKNSEINISGYRYFQLKIVLNSSNNLLTPRLRGYRIYYVQDNLKPKIERLKIIKPRIKVLKEDEKVKKVADNKYLVLNWKARDPNYDQLNYTVYIRKVANKNWILLKENILLTEILLRTELYEDGVYLAKVVAEDSFSNPPALAKQNQIVSSPFIIDSTAPHVDEIIVNKNEISFTVRDETSLVARVLYSMDGIIWYPVFPLDKITDSSIEKFSFSISRSGSRKNIFIKVFDEFNNYKVFSKELF